MLGLFSSGKEVKCANCIWYEKEGPETGKCHKDPPDMDSPRRLPQVKENDYCSFWKGK